MENWILILTLMHGGYQSPDVEIRPVTFTSKAACGMAGEEWYLTARMGSMLALKETAHYLCVKRGG
jgi:hypothetical protein